MHQRTIQRQLEAELDLVETLVDLSRDDRALVRASCESAVKTAATQRANPSQTAETKGNQLPRIVFTALIDAIEQQTSTTDADRYQRDRLQRTQFHRHAGIEGFLVALDRSLALTQTQVEQVRSLLNDTWQSDWNNVAMTAADSGLITLRRQLAALPRDKFERILSAQQKQCLRGPDTTPFRTLMVRMDKDDLAQQLRRFRDRQHKHASLIANAKLAELLELCKLTNEQQTSLRKALSQSVEDIVQRQETAFKLMKTDGPANVPQTLMEHLSTHVSDQIDGDSTWERALKQLPEPSAASLDSRRLQRSNMRKDQAVRCVVSGLGQQFRMTGQQLNALFESLKQQTDGDGIDAVNRELLEVKDSDLKPLFTAGQWRRVSAMLDARRSQLGIN